MTETHASEDPADAPVPPTTEESSDGEVDRDNPDGSAETPGEESGVEAEPVEETTDGELSDLPTSEDAAAVEPADVPADPGEETVDQEGGPDEVVDGEEITGEADSQEGPVLGERGDAPAPEDVETSESAGEVSEAGEGPSGRVSVPPDEDSPEEVSLFVAPVADPSPPPSNKRSVGEMGWIVMAAAGALLLTAGFAAGFLFPDASSEAEVTTTTAAPVTASEPSTSSTTAPAAPSSSTTVAPATAAAPTTTVAESPPAEVEATMIDPPELVATDEPVADVANRMVPSVVHLEIRSDDLFEQGAGSGVIFDSGGYILTAAHVVSAVMEGDAELTVRLSNGDRLPGEVVGTDPDSDIAVVQVDRTGLIPAELALGDPPRVGQMAVAVGSPWGLESSVTSGVISAVDRIVEGKLLHQSDAVLYPGNSGGALADRYGRLIGINVSIFTDSTTRELVEFQGVGFAVPVDVAHRVAQALMAGEPVHTAFLGVSGRDTLSDAGVEIMEVFPGSGAETAGLQVGDVVVAVGGRPVTGIGDLAARIRHLTPGDVIVLSVVRGEEELNLAAILTARSEVMPEESEDDPSEEEPEDE